MSQNTFEIAQALRQSHCERKDHAHECVGEVTIKRGLVELNCQLCGKGCEISDGYHSVIADRLRSVFYAAGLQWDSLSYDAQCRAIKQYHAKSIGE